MKKKNKKMKSKPSGMPGNMPNKTTCSYDKEVEFSDLVSEFFEKSKL